MHNGFKIPAAAILAAAAGLTTYSAMAQEAGGITASATTGIGVISDDDGTRARGDLSFSLGSVTRTQGFELGISTGLEYPDADDEFELADPELRFSYRRTGKNAEFEAFASFLRQEIGTLVLDETPDSIELRNDTGYRNDTRLGARLTFGKEAPFGGNFGLGVRRVNYTDLTDDSLNDYVSRDSDLTLRFTVDPRLDLRLTARVEDTESEGTGTDRTTTTFGTGADLRISESLRASLDLNFVEIEESADGGPTSTDSGPTFALAILRDLPNGEARFDLSSILTDDGTRVEVRAGRSHELRLGEFDWSAGLSRGGDGDVDGLLQVGYGRESRNGSLEAGYQRSVNTSIFGEETLVDQVSVGYSYALSDVTNFQTGLAYRNYDYFTEGSESVRKLELDMSLTRQLTSDIDMVASFSHERSRTGDEDAESENTIYLGVQRALSWRP